MKNKYASWFLSLTIHVLAFAGIGLALHGTKQLKPGFVRSQNKRMAGAVSASAHNISLHRVFFQHFMSLDVAPAAHNRISKNNRHAQAQKQKKAQNRKHGHGDQASAHQVLSGSALSQLQKKIWQAIEKNKIFPRQALGRNISGQNQVAFILHPNGRLTNIKIIKKSPFSFFNQSTLQAVRASSPITDPLLRQMKKPMPLQLTLMYRP